jgi:hypothetical protein
VSELFENGRVIDLILVFMALEGVILWRYRHATGRGVRASSLIATLFAGASLLLALRGALTGSSWEWVAAWLTAGLVAHLYDLRCRWSN